MVILPGVILRDRFGIISEAPIIEMGTMGHSGLQGQVKHALFEGLDFSVPAARFPRETSSRICPLLILCAAISKLHHARSWFAGPISMYPRFSSPRPKMARERAPFGNPAKLSGNKRQHNENIEIALMIRHKDLRLPKQDILETDGFDLDTGEPQNQSCPFSRHLLQGVFADPEQGQYHDKHRKEGRHHNADCNQEC
jgi:hypothetical protein